MAYKYITTSDATQVETGYVRLAVVQVNADLTGTIAVIDDTAGETADVATITNPAAGNTYYYHGLKNGFRVKASTTCDITCSTLIV